MTKQAFKKSITACRSSLTFIMNNYEYLSEEEQNEIINAVFVLTSIGGKHAYKQYERIHRISIDNIKFFELKLDKKPLMNYKTFVQWNKENYLNYVNHCHLSEHETEIKPLKPYQLKEYYKAYLSWFCKYQTGQFI